MSDVPFTGEQQEYLKGFMAGVEARRGALGLPAAPVAGPAADASDIHRAAQDRTVAAGGKLTAEEEAKRKKHPLDRFDEINALAAGGEISQGHRDLPDQVPRVVLRGARRRMRSCAGCGFRAAF